MKAKTALRAMIGLSLVAGTVVATRPANATVLKNFVNEYATNGAGGQGWCMGVSGGNPASGTPLIVWDCNGNADQNWTPATFWGSFIQLKSGINSSLCAGLSGGATSNGTQLKNISCHLTPNGSDDQGWLPVFATWDATGHSCNIYQNEKYHSQIAGHNPPLPERVFGASGGAGNVKNGTNIILWDQNGNSDQTWCSY